MCGVAAVGVFGENWAGRHRFVQRTGEEKNELKHFWVGGFWLPTACPIGGRWPIWAEPSTLSPSLLFSFFVLLVYQGIWLLGTLSTHDRLFPLLPVSLFLFSQGTPR
jgi:hypothetical protein